MPAIFLYFHAHQPYRLHNLSFFDLGDYPSIVNTQANKKHLVQVSKKIYRPFIEQLSALTQKHKNEFRYAFLLSGTLMEQLESDLPEMVQLFKSVFSSESVELLGETYYHSLAGLYSTNEFIHQVKLHRFKIFQNFKKEPLMFRNTDLEINPENSTALWNMGFKGIIGQLEKPISGKINSKKSYDDKTSITRLFIQDSKYSNQLETIITDNAPEKESLAHFIHGIRNSKNEVICIGIDLDKLKMNVNKTNQALHHLNLFVNEVINRGDLSFTSVSDLIEKIEIISPGLKSSYNAFIPNILQKEALRFLYSIEEKIKINSSKDIVEKWRQIQSVEHIKWMGEQISKEKEIPLKSPYKQPHDAYINFMNAISSLDIFNNSLNPSTS